MAYNIKLLKQLRKETAASISDIRRALEETSGDYKKAKELLRLHGIEKAGKKEGRQTRAGIVETYIHYTMTSGATVVISCETDFVSRTSEFKNLAHEIAMQVNATGEENIDKLLTSPWVRDESKTVGDLIKEHVAKFGENIKIKEVKKFEV